MRVAGPVLLLSLAACSGVVGGPAGGDDDDGGGADAGVFDPVETVRVCADALFTTIAEAIAASPTGTRIDVCGGTYFERLVLDAKVIQLRGEGADTTILDAGGGTALAVTGGAELWLEGFTVRDGGSSGLRCDASAVQITASRFEDNDGGARGGGALLTGCTGAISDSVFTGNTADEGGAVAILGGAVALRRTELRDNLARVRGGAIYQGSDGEIDDCTITDNQSGWTGGGVYVFLHAPVLRDSTIARNTSVLEGGGVYLFETTAQLFDNQITDNVSGDDGGGLRIFTSAARLERNTIARNHAATDGGGLKISHLPAVLIDNTISDNIADASGGGLELDNDSSVVTGGVISGNRASRGGGVHAQLFPWHHGRLEGIAITGNDANHGGALYLEKHFYPITLRDLTITGNTAHRGGALYVRATTFHLHNSLIAGNGASVDGGGLYLAQPLPWSDPCPCPAVGPMNVEFVVLHANQAQIGSAMWIDAPGLAVESSILDGHAGTAVVVEGGHTPAWQYNDSWPAAFGGMGSPSGGGNLAMAPSFVDAAGGDFHLLAQSACVDAGDPVVLDRDGSRADMGRYAGPDAP